MSVAAAVAGIALTAAGCSGGDGSTGAAAPSSSRAAPSVPPAASTTPGPVGPRAALKVGLPKYPDAVTDATGRALYTFTGDEHGNVTCLGACATAWPPLLTSDDPTITGADPDDPGTQGLGNGTLQASFDGWPLYYYSGDKKPGDAKGVGRHAFGGQFLLILKNGNRLG
jgi:predicted lipoprotein with Yx(FWY)xxD motif